MMFFPLLLMFGLLIFFVFRAATHYGVSGSADEKELENLLRELTAIRNDLRALRDRQDDLANMVNDIQTYRLPPQRKRDE
ncbi:MAG: hypothetical protein O3A46_15520 [Candidatus Poribacteria bacterium]|nr:hypothetical protein [Candidatus Poribacteria bacterium]